MDINIRNLKKSYYISIMLHFQQLLTAISLLQVPNIFINLSGDTDAETSLHSLSRHIETANEVTSFVSVLWDYYVDYAEEEQQKNLHDLIENYSNLIANITEFGTGVTGAEECSIAFKQTPVVGEDAIQYNGSSLEDVFINLQRSANAEISKINEQYKYLQAEYETSCGETKINCEGTSKTIVAEVKRLIPGIRSAYIDLILESLLLGYEIVVDRWSQNAYIASHLDAAVQNITSCIASQIEESTLEPSNKTFKQSNRMGSILDSYSDLVIVSEDALLESQKILLSYQTSVADQSAVDYRVTISNIRGFAHVANETINFLQAISLTQICALPDVIPVINSSLSRSLREYTDIGIYSVGLVFSQGLNNINGVVEEVTSIALQTDGCSGSTTCDYLVEKIDRKMTEIPLTMKSVANSTAVLMHKSVSAVRKSRYNVVRDILEQLGSEIVSFAYCIKINYHE